MPWNTGGSATVADGLLTVDGARANTTSLYDSNRSLDFAATFTADPFQHVGFGNDFDDAPVGDVQHRRRVAPGGPVRADIGAWRYGDEHAAIADVDPLDRA